MDVSSFSPEELSIKMIDNRVEIFAKHEERDGKYGYASQQMTKHTTIPEV